MLAYTPHNSSVFNNQGNTSQVGLLNKVTGTNTLRSSLLPYRDREDWMNHDPENAKSLALKYHSNKSMNIFYLSEAGQEVEFSSSVKRELSPRPSLVMFSRVIDNLATYVFSLAAPDYGVSPKSSTYRSIHGQISSLKLGWAGIETFAPSLEALDALQSLFDVLPEWSKVPEVTVDDDGTIDVSWQKNGKMFSIAIKDTGTSIVTLSPSSERLKAKAYSKNELDRLTRVLSLPFVEELVAS